MLGDGKSATPSPVKGIDGQVTAISSYGGAKCHSCALLADGTLRCWGTNTDGQLGDGTKSDGSNTAVAVVGLGGKAVAVSAGRSITCALLADGSVECWGSNYNNALGDGTDVADRPQPAPVVGLGGKAVAVSAGNLAACALLADGTVQCWGNNEKGQLGIGTIKAEAPYGVKTPTTALLADKAVAVAAGQYFACAILIDGSVQCWGYNRGTQVNTHTP